MFLRKVHPGGVLKDAIEESGLSISEAARQLCVPPNRLSQIVREERAISSDTALRLGKWLGTGPEIWMNMQRSYDLVVAGEVMQGELSKIRPLKTDEPEAA